MNRFPKSGRIYTFAEIHLLDLEDSPYLRVLIKGSLQNIQDSHVTVDAMIKACPLFVGSLWKYVRTTHESIPLFTYAGPTDLIDKLFDTEPYEDSEIENALWVTPKGSPREQ